VSKRVTKASGSKEGTTDARADSCLLDTATRLAAATFHERITDLLCETGYLTEPSRSCRVLSPDELADSKRSVDENVARCVVARTCRHGRRIGNISSATLTLPRNSPSVTPTSNSGGASGSSITVD
jgi:hypothetical protein